MEDSPYQNREIDTMFDEIKETLSRIEAQTTKTNGRVSSLESWKYISMGATGVLTTIVVPILSWALYTLVNINQVVHESVDEALSAYNINNSQDQH